MSLKKWLNEHHLAFSALAIAVVVSFLYSLVLQGVQSPYLRAEGALYDYVARFGRPAEKDPRIVFLADDSASHTLDQLWEEDLAESPTLRLMKKRVWSRQIWADVLDRLAKAGAKVVAFDYMFKGEDEGDAAFRAAIERHAKVVVLGSHIDNEAALNQQMPTIAPPSSTLLGEAGDPRVGFVNMFPDEDEVIRRMRFRVTREELAGKAAPSDVKEYESLAARMVRQAGEGDKIPSGRGQHRIRYAFKGETLLETSKPTSLFTIFVPAFWQANYENGEFFRDKVVLVGPEGNYTKDVALSPFGTIAGPEFHLNAANALLTDEFLWATPHWLDYLLIVGGALFAWLICRFIRNAIIRVVAVPVLGFGFYVASVALYNNAQVFPVFSPTLSLVATVFVATAWQQLIERLEKNRQRKIFERLVSRDIVKELVDNPQSYLNTAGGARKAVSILFSDVRGFTSITETGDPQALVAQLNEYFGHMVAIVFANKGTLDKFIGDAVMAHWGSIHTEGEKDDAVLAVRTAVQMRKRLSEINREWAERGMKPLHIGIGINCGEAIAGNLGCEEKSEISLIGDAVNIASRLEGITKEYHTDLIIGETVAVHVRDAFVLRTVGLNQPKGKTKPLELFTVLDERQPGAADPAWLTVHENGVRLYRKREFAAAAEQFRTVLAALPGDWLAQDYLNDCLAFLSTPPPADWNAVHVMKSK
jgi:adenylate cyclase